MLGVRHAGERHEDAIGLLQTVNLPREIVKTKSRQLSRLLAIKNAAEYEERLMTEKDAIEAVRDRGALQKAVAVNFSGRDPLELKTGGSPYVFCHLFDLWKKGRFQHSIAIRIQICSPGWSGIRTHPLSGVAGFDPESSAIRPSLPSLCLWLEEKIRNVKVYTKIIREEKSGLKGTFITMLLDYTT